MTTGGGNSDEPVSHAVATAIDRWETLLEQIAEDVARIRGVIVLAWYVGWVLLAVALAVTIGAIARG